MFLPLISTIISIFVIIVIIEIINIYIYSYDFPQGVVWAGGHMYEPVGR